MPGRFTAGPTIARPDDARQQPDGITIRRVVTDVEYEQCMKLQHQIWGENFSGSVPIVILSLAQKLGGVVAGAFDGHDKLLGFVFGMTGLIDGQLGHWSDLLAVDPSARDRGIGRRLKMYQRDALLPLGIHAIHWTYDPLVARNAYLNLVKLGATATEYVIDFYGADTGSLLHGSLGTDRFITRWDITGDDDAGRREDAHAIATPEEGPFIVNPSREDGPPLLRDLPSLPSIRIEIPSDIYTLIEQSPDVALAWRKTTRHAFTWYLDRGYRVAGFSAAPDIGRYFYTVRAPEA